MNIITIELCAEDRARLDKLQATMDKLAAPIAVEPEQLSFFEVVEPIPEVIEPEKEPEPEAAPELQPEPEQPKIEKSDIQKKVVALSGAGKKDEVRGIVLAYGNTKVSDIPEDKLAEVWEKLTALGG